MADLSEHELAALDFIIAAKKAGVLPEAFINNIVNDVNNLANNVGHVANAVAAVTAAAAAVAAVAAGAVSPGATVSATGGEGLHLNTLLRIRHDALAAQSR